MNGFNHPIDMGEVETAKANIYDDEGRTRIPDDIREKLDIGKGDVLKFVVQGEHTFLYVEEDD